MPDFDDLARDRWDKMPPVIAGFAAGGIVLGIVVAALILGNNPDAWQAARAARVVFGLVACVGFAVGLVVGVTVDTLVFKPRREEARKRRRRREQERGEEARGPWRP